MLRYGVDEATLEELMKKNSCQNTQEDDDAQKKFLEVSLHSHGKRKVIIFDSLQCAMLEEERSDLQKFKLLQSALAKLLSTNDK